MTSVGNDMLDPLCTSQHSGRFRFAGIGAEAVWYGLQEIMVCWEGVWLRAQCTADAPNTCHMQCGHKGVPKTR